MNKEKDVLIDEYGRIKNWYYGRSIKTKYDEIEGISLRRGRKGNFRTGIFDPYSRHIGIDELIISLYFEVISTTKAPEIVKTIFQIHILDNRYYADNFASAIAKYRTKHNKPVTSRYRMEKLFDPGTKMVNANRLI